MRPVYPNGEYSSNILLVYVDNRRELLGVFGSEFNGVINNAILCRLIDCGIPASTMILEGDILMIRLIRRASKINGARYKISDLLQVMRACIEREPIECERGRGYIRVSIRSHHQSGEHVSKTGNWMGVISDLKQQRNETMRVEMSSAVSLLDELRYGNLVLAFQPIELLGEEGENACLYSEALLRRVSPEDSRIYTWPNAIEALERTGCIFRLDCSVIMTVTELLKLHPSQRLGCNISAASLRDNIWWDSFLDYLNVNQPVARRLTLEITETSVIFDIEEAMTLITGLRACGVRIAIDDMGAGHSSLHFLSCMRPDVVKIDRSVLLRSRDVNNSPDLLRNLTKVCRDYAPCVVVEGVETTAELTAARYAGVQAVQGFLIQKPHISPDWLQLESVVVTDIHARTEHTKFLFDVQY